MKKLLLVLLAASFFMTNAFALTEVRSLEIGPNSSFDFGDIQQDKGPVSTVFTVKNISDQVIKVNRLSTSCGCTTAEMDLADFQPGDSRELKVTFDPMVHPDQSGPIARVVYLQTSDPVMPEIEINLDANVIAAKSKSAVVFFNEACQDCGELVKDFYPAFFQEYGYQMEPHDYINVRSNRQLLNQYNEKWGVPFELQSHIETFVNDKLLIGGHVPETVIRYLLENPDEYDKILVYQDKMHGEETDYKVWNFEGEIKSYPIDEPITTYLHGTKEKGGGLSSSAGFWPLFGIITISAFLDGINPCAIAVLLFFIAFLFTLKRTKASIWKMSLVYIAAIYLAYFLIGIGIAQAIVISGAPHLMAYIGSYLVITLGVLQIIGVLMPSFPIKLRIPVNTKSVIEKWLYKATIPAAFIGGFVVGLCTFPCSGGIYVAIIGMLASSQTYFGGLAWMVWYNFIFILPLLILLCFAGNPFMLEKLQKLERKQAKSSKLLIGVTMVLLGLVIIYFFA